eukprot:TRINITY_DN6344_c0_g1_i1.p2 TRINITY_DN6344_c0_g1~~TRINITY_DN6344_c0_g1_i1.p2  ORF type:complete len:115 (-),score=10.02 TRINITY_DN6344_c0_g1_i1:152-496(-)
MCIRDRYQRRVHGLHPKATKLYRNSEIEGPDQCMKNIIDGEVLSFYPYLSIPLQIRLASKIGTSRDTLLSMLNYLRGITSIVQERSAVQFLLQIVNIHCGSPMFAFFFCNIQNG